MAGVVFFGALHRPAGFRIVRLQDASITRPNFNARAGRRSELRHSEHRHLIVGTAHIDDGDQCAFLIQIVELIALRHGTAPLPTPGSADVLNCVPDVS